MRLRQRLYIVVLLMLLSGCVTVINIDGEQIPEWFEVHSLPVATEALPTISPSVTISSPQWEIISTSEPVMKPGTWYFIAVTRQDRRVTLYLNSMNVSSRDFAPLDLDAPISLKIGRREGQPGFYFNGRIDEVEIFNRTALTPVQIAGLYNAGRFGKCKGFYSWPCIPPPDGLTGWWPGDGSTEDIVSSRNGNFKGGATTGTGLVDQAFVFDGEDDYIEVPDDPALNFGTGDFTVDLWVNFNDLSGEQVLVEKWVQGVDYEHNYPLGWTLTKLNTQALVFSMEDGLGGKWSLSIQSPVYPTATPVMTQTVLPSISPTTLITQSPE